MSTWYRCIRSIITTTGVIVFASSLLAQTAPGGSTETKAQELTRLGLAVDPGPDPDPTKIFIRNGKAYTIQKVQKIYTKKHENPKFIYPSRFVNYPAEIYRQEGDFVWVFMEELPPAQPPKTRVDHKGREIQIRPYTPEQLKKFQELRKEFDEVDLLSSNVTVRFRDASAGLPQAGSWRNSLAVADMNEDGKVDLILPPQRAAIPQAASIYLGDGVGAWKKWEQVQWPTAFSYGNVVSGDLNRDGHQDLVFGVHLFGILAFHGNGNGKFVNASEGLPRAYATRRVALADLDRDGWLDIVALNEGPALRMERRAPESKLKAYFNRNKGTKWELVDVTVPERQMGGDWLAVANLNGDSHPDLVTSSNYFSGPDTVYLGDGAKKWKPWGQGDLPFYSYYYALTTGRFSGGKNDDAIVSFFRSWPQRIDPEAIVYPDGKNIVGLERLTWTKQGPRRTPIVRWFDDSAIWALGSGDVDGDGHLDLVYVPQAKGETVLLLGDGKGSFKKGRLSGVTHGPERTYDVQLLDVNADQKLDLLLMFEAEEGESNGSVRVFLNQGVGTEP